MKSKKHQSLQEDGKRQNFTHSFTQPVVSCKHKAAKIKQKANKLSSFKSHVRTSLAYGMLMLFKKKFIQKYDLIQKCHVTTSLAYGILMSQASKALIL